MIIQEAKQVIPDSHPIVFSEITNPAEMEKNRAQFERMARNSDWLQMNVPEIYSKYRGRCICIACEELFVSDDARDVVAQARAAHPEDNGFIIRYIPKEKQVRI